VPSGPVVVTSMVISIYGLHSHVDSMLSSEEILQFVYLSPFAVPLFPSLRSMISFLSSQQAEIQKSSPHLSIAVFRVAVTERCSVAQPTQISPTPLSPSLRSLISLTIVLAELKATMADITAKLFSLISFTIVLAELKATMADITDKLVSLISLTIVLAELKATMADITARLVFLASLTIVLAELKATMAELYCAASYLWTPAHSSPTLALPAPPPMDWPVVAQAVRARPQVPRHVVCRRCQGRGHREAVCPSAF